MVKASANQQLFLGIDGGGSKCQACIVDHQGGVLGSGTSGPANPLHGVEQTLESVRTAAERALDNAGLPANTMASLIAGVGLAGVNLPSLFTLINSWPHPFAAMYLTTDLRIASLGAHSGAEGAVIITGTGSCGYTSVEGEDYILGAHGFPYGDQGSGAWLGLEAIKAVLLAFDDLGPETQLTESVADFLQARGLMIVERMSGAKPSDYARLAPLVLDAAEAGDAVALRIVRQGAAYISAVAHKLLAHQPARLSLLGGLAERLTPWLDDGIAARVSPPLGPPEMGAVFYARQQHQFVERT